ncbi:hypothetical protein FOCC_FOCC002098 [Frankliniella occidentalis]|nr:hypothetical protein FOCC_FOCC002098 [Frankliniella occidentalis]
MYNEVVSGRPLGVHCTHSNTQPESDPSKRKKREKHIYCLVLFRLINYVIVTVGIELRQRIMKRKQLQSKRTLRLKL